MSLSRRFGLFTLAATVTFGIAIFAAPTFINILTGGTGGVYYPMGVGLSQIYGHDVQGAKTSIQATKALIKNFNLLQAGCGELAPALGDSVADTQNGVTDAGFKAPLEKLWAIGNTCPSYIQVVASQASGIKILTDLKGKRISVGASKGGTELNTRTIFKAAGLSYEDMDEAKYLPYAESVELIKNRQLDATLRSSGLGMAAVRDLAPTMPVTFVAIPVDVVAKIDGPAYHTTSIPVNTYNGQRQDVPTVAIDSILVSHSGVSDELAYQMTKLMSDNLPCLVIAHAATRDITLDRAAKNLPIPLHPDAERSYRKKGVLPK